MKTQAEWDAMKEELEELKELRAEISERIHVLNVRIAHHRKTMANPPDKTNTIAYQMFGKRLKDLTPDEYRIYYNARQRARREKLRGN